MLKLKYLPIAGAFVLAAISSASSTSAAIPSPAYVDAQTGTDTGTCPLTAPCATLNYALSQISAGGQIIFLRDGVFGPIRLTAAVSMTGLDPGTHVQIVADSTAQPGCIGAAAGTCGANNNYAIEIAAGASDTIKIGFVAFIAGPSGAGAMLVDSVGKIQISHSIFRGNGVATGPIVALYPNNGSTSQAQVYFSNNDVGFNNGNASNGGAVEVKPSGTTSLKLHFNHVEVHNAAYGIRTDGSLLTSPSATVATFISESEFFSFNVAAMNAFSTSGTGTVDAIFAYVNVLNSSVALKANGPQSFVVLTNCIVGGNGQGVQITNGANVLTAGNNTIQGNGTNISGTMTNVGTQ